MTETVPQADEIRIAELERQIAENEAWKIRMVDTAIRYAEQNGYETNVRRFLEKEGLDAPTRYRVYMTRSITRTEHQSATVNVYAKTPEAAQERALQMNQENGAQGHFYWETRSYDDNGAAQSDITIDRVRTY